MIHGPLRVGNEEPPPDQKAHLREDPIEIDPPQEVVQKGINHGHQDTLRTDIQKVIRQMKEMVAIAAGPHRENHRPNIVDGRAEVGLPPIVEIILRGTMSLIGAQALRALNDLEEIGLLRLVAVKQ